MNAMNELNIKKFLAYASITHMGYILLGGTFSTSSINSYTTYYFLFYILSNLPLLLLLTGGQFINIKKQNKTYLKVNEEILYFTEFKNIRLSNPFVADMFILIIFATAGIPPFATFMAKYLILGKSYFIYKSIFFLSFILFINLISSYYYIKILKIFLFTPSKNINNDTKNNQIYFSSRLPLLKIKFIIYLVIGAIVFSDIIFEILNLKSDYVIFYIQNLVLI